MNKKLSSKWFIIGLAFIIVSAVLIIVVMKAPSVLAQAGISISSENAPTANMPLIDRTIGDDPDENGYTGSTTQGTGNSAASEENYNNVSFWDKFFGQPQPDMNPVNNQGDSLSPNWTDFYYVFDAGATLRPRDSIQKWAYPGVGCLYATQNTSTLFNVDLQLPQGSRIDYLRILYYDTSPTDSNSWITIYDGAGNYSDLIAVSSTGNTGYGYVVSNYVGVVVDNLTNSYVLNWSPTEIGPTQQLCGLRVAYRLP